MLGFIFALALAGLWMARRGDKPQPRGALESF
jgi:hypothetical protein